MEPFTQNITVRWADLDPNGHVRHSVYYDYGAQARVALLEKNGLGLEWMARNRVGPVLFREQAKFLRELHMSEEITIDFRVAGLSEDGRKWRIAHNIYRGETLCAVLDMDGAWLDLKARRITVPPEELRVAFEKLPHTEDFEILASGKANA